MEKSNPSEFEKFLSLKGFSSKPEAEKEVSVVADKGYEIETLKDLIASFESEKGFGELVNLFVEPKNIYYLPNFEITNKDSALMDLLQSTFGFEIIERRGGLMMVGAETPLPHFLAFLCAEILKDKPPTDQEIKSAKINSDRESAFREFLERRNANGIRPQPIFSAPIIKARTETLQTTQRNSTKQPSKIPVIPQAYNFGKVITLSDIDNNTKIENRKKLGMDCFNLSNEFRKSRGKPEVTWNEELFFICLEHSKNMAEGKVGFGHGGFQNRVRMITFSHDSVSENVAYCENYTDVNIPQTIVDGWINSPGHCKNLLSRANVSAVAGYCCPHSSRYYFTQMFAWQR